MGITKTYTRKWGKLPSRNQIEAVISSKVYLLVGNSGKIAFINIFPVGVSVLTYKAFRNAGIRDSTMKEGAAKVEYKARSCTKRCFGTKLQSVDFIACETIVGKNNIGWEGKDMHAHKLIVYGCFQFLGFGRLACNKQKNDQRCFDENTHN